MLFSKGTNVVIDGVTVLQHGGLGAADTPVPSPTLRDRLNRILTGHETSKDVTLVQWAIREDELPLSDRERNDLIAEFERLGEGAFADEYLKTPGG